MQFAFFTKIREGGKERVVECVVPESLGRSAMLEVEQMYWSYKAGAAAGSLLSSALLQLPIKLMWAFHQCGGK